MVHSYHVVLSAHEHVDKERNHEGFPEKALPYCFPDMGWTIVAMRILLIACNMMNEGIQVVVVYIGFSCMRRTSVNAAK